MNRKRCTLTLFAACTAAATVLAGAALATSSRSDDRAIDPAPDAAPTVKVTQLTSRTQFPVTRDNPVVLNPFQQGGIAGGNPNCPAAGDCFTTHPTPGCEDEGCCNLVCNIDPFCCDNFGEWDFNCVLAAEQNCVEPLSCGASAAGSCCGASFSPFCNDEECCEQICAINPDCCDDVWSQACADLAIMDPKDGGCTACDVVPPVECTPDAGTCCQSNGTPGCDDPFCCAAVCEIDPFCCEVVYDSFCAIQAQFASECIALCSPEGCGDDIAISCCAANIPALRHPFCNDEACCNTVCAADPFCCDEEWDFLCALGANDLCGCDAFFSTANFTTSFQGFGFTHGADISADILQLVEPGVVREITFSLVNFGSPITAVDLDLIFMPVDTDVDGFIIEPDPNGPNVVVINIADAVDQGAGTVALYFITDEDGFFDTNDLGGVSPQALWAGMRINDVEGNIIDDVGQGLFHPPTVGLALDLFWLEGFGLAFFGGPPDGPVAGFGWELLGEPTVPPTCGDPAAGSCFEPNMTTACDDADCCETVCACDLFCCEVAWDDFCVGPNKEVPGCSAKDLCKEPTTGACLISDCPQDLTNSGSVGVADLLQLLGCWGPVTPGCEDADLTNSGSVGVADLLDLLGAWGPCPAPSCQITTAAECTAAAGDYQGDGTSCP